MKNLAHYLRMIKFSHTIFALPFALGAVAVLSRGANPTVQITPVRVALIIVAFTAMRSFAMAFNRLADATIDAENPRTAVREIPSGNLSIQQVKFFAVISLLILVAAAWFLAPLAAYLALPAVLLAAGYSYTKHFTWTCHFWLGAAIGQAPIAVYIALAGEVPVVAALMALTLLFYIAGFDILYSLQDANFDRAHGLHSVPSRFGVQRAMYIARASHLIMAAVLASLLFALNATAAGWLGFAVILALLVVEHVLVGSAKNPRYEKIPVAFFNVNSGVSLCYLATILVAV